MCLDPETDRLFRVTRPARDLPFRVRRAVTTRRTGRDATALSASAAWALETLAGDDDLVSRGWVVLSREAHP
jgi:hypothetical protein